MNKIKHLDPWSFATFNFLLTFLIGLIALAVVILGVVFFTNTFGVITPSLLSYTLLKLLGTSLVSGLNGLITAILYNNVLKQQSPILGELEEIVG